MENLIRQYIAAYNQMDVPGMIALLHDVIVFENVSNTNGSTTTSGKADFERLARQSLSMFQSRRQTIRSLTLGNVLPLSKLSMKPYWLLICPTVGKQAKPCGCGA